MIKQELFNKADYYKDIIGTHNPFSNEQLMQVDNYFRTEYTYSSNSMEGNGLTLTATKALLEEGITSEVKMIKDYFEAVGHAEACDYMLSMARTEQLELSENVIKRLHFLFYIKMDHEEAGQYRKVQIDRSGTGLVPPKAEEVAHFMEHFINQMQSSRRLMHPIEYAAICHKRLLDIHPFKDGNGQVARLLMNLILINAGYGITSISPTLRNKYRNAVVLSQRANNPDIDALIELVAECVIEAEKEYCRLLGIKN